MVPILPSGAPPAAGLCACLARARESGDDRVRLFGAVGAEGLEMTGAFHGGAVAVAAAAGGRCGGHGRSCIRVLMDVQPWARCDPTRETFVLTVTMPAYLSMKIRP